MTLPKNNLKLRLHSEGASGTREQRHRFLRWVFGVCFKLEFLDILYGTIRFFAYAYLFAIIISFFSQNHRSFYISTLDALSSPYMGAIGIYFVLKEALLRNGKNIPRNAGETFFILWSLLLLISTMLVFLSPHFHANAIYNLILKNSLAAILFRIGLFLR
jgi:hypothetical protein